MANETHYLLDLRYYKGIFDEDEFQLQKNKLRESGVELTEYDQNGKFMAAMDLVSDISLRLSDPLLQAILFNLISSTTYDILKANIIWMWNSLRGKKLNKFTLPNNIEEKDVSFSLYVDIASDKKIDFKISGNLSDEQKSKCIDNMFEYLRTNPINKERYSEYAVYNIDNSIWNIINIQEEILKRKQASKNDKN